MFKYSLIFLSLTIFFVGCSIQIHKDPKDIAERYLKEQGYTILSHENSLEPYTLTKEKLVETSPMDVWVLQPFSPDKYLGKEVYGEIFIIKNHPLDNWESGTTKALGKTRIYLMIIDGKVIGGASLPVTKEPLWGGLYSIDGKNFDEIHPNENWIEWSDKWFDKYGEYRSLLDSGGQ